mgnify:CR=1 FL=1
MRKRPLAWMSHGVIQVLENLCWSSPVQKANEVVKTSALCTSEQQQLWQIKTAANQGIVHLIVRTNLDLKLDLLACIHARPNKAAAKRLLDSWCRSSKSLSA